MIKYRYEKNIATVCVCVAMLSNVVVLLAFNQAVEMPFAHCGFYGNDFMETLPMQVENTQDWKDYYCIGGNLSWQIDFKIEPFQRLDFIQFATILFSNWNHLKWFLLNINLSNFFS